VGHRPNEANALASVKVAPSLLMNEIKGADKVSGADSEQRTNLRWTFGSLSGS